MFKVKDGIQIGSTTFVDGSRNVGASNITATAITHTGDLTMTAAEGREIKTYMPSSYTTADIVSGHEYGWYNDYWRVGMSRSGGSSGFSYRFNYSGTYVASLTTGGEMQCSNVDVTGSYQINDVDFLNSSGARNLRSTNASYSNAFSAWNSLDDTTNNPANGWYYGLRVSHGDAITYYSATIAISFFDDVPYIGRRQNGSHQGWRKFAMQGLSPTFDNVYATGDITAFYSSDESLKENVKPIDNALDKISKIKGVYFDWTDEYINGTEVDGYKQPKSDVGVIAQDIQKVLPEIVATKENGKLGVRYEKIVALLIEGIKEQQAQIDELKQLLEK